MNNLESLVLPLAECKQLAEKEIFKAGETVYKWQERFSTLDDWKNEENKRWYLCESNTVHQLSHNEVSAPMLEEMVLALSKIKNHSLSTALHNIQWRMYYNGISDPKLAVYALLMETVNHD